MKAVYFILPTVALILPVAGENPDTEKNGKSVSAEVQKAIDEFNRLKKEGKAKLNEVTVVLPAPDEEQLETDSEPTETAGKVLDEAEDESQATPPEKFSEITNPPSMEKANDQPGLEVRVESIRSGTGKLDPSKIKLRSSFPAKRMASPPQGWLTEKFGEIPALQREVELQPGTVVSLEISPHVLIPDADGDRVFAVTEPGFNPSGGYRQGQTVSAILARSAVQLDEDAKQLGNAISELNGILSSLPSPETGSDPVEEVEE